MVPMLYGCIDNSGDSDGGNDSSDGGSSRSSDGGGDSNGES
jgi:hypothetical protein